MKSVTLGLVITLSSLAAPRIQAAQQFVGIDLFESKPYSIDVRTGQASLLIDVGVTIHPWVWSALAKDSTGRLYGAYVDIQNLTGTAIYEIDPNTGQATLAAFTALAGITAMSFGANDALYVGHDRFPGRGGSPVDLYQVDLPTGVATLIGDIGSTGLAALTYDGVEMWAYDSDLGLARVDVRTGVMSDVNAGFVGPLELSESIRFGDDGILYQVDAAL